MRPIWIIETRLNAACEAVAAAARDAGHRVIRWSTGDRRPRVDDAVFLGSLTECAAMPGVIGDPDRLRVGAWLPQVGSLALNGQIIATRVGQVSPASAPWDRVFARPDSAMKPFSGRVLDRAQLSPGALDLGFYYDDPSVPVVLAEAVALEREWRFVAVDGRLVSDSGYRADGVRSAVVDPPPAGAIRAAEAALAVSPEPTVVIDIAELSAGGFRLVEFNLFSGSDLYGCEPRAIVEAIGASVGATSG